MKVFVLDITARNAAQYNPSLCSHIVTELPVGSSVTLISTQNHGNPHNYDYKKLINLIPAKYRGIKNTWKRVLRAIEVCINYFIVIIYIACHRPDVLHIQWLTLIDICSIERCILWIIKLLSLKTKIFLTVHNIYPHDLDDSKKAAYRSRFLSIARYIDGFLVHLVSAKDEFHSEYGISKEKIHIAYHGLYVPEGYMPDNLESNAKTRIIMYGFQNRYKGADILIEAIGQLPNEIRDKFEVVIVGKSDESLLKQCLPSCEKYGIQWINRFVSDDELYSLIGKSDIIMLPYRAISQSGVLFLALSFHKPIITSGLTSFKETLEGYSDDWFFAPEDSKSLSMLLERFIKGDIDKHKMLSCIENLCGKYSWNNTAKATIVAYKSLF